MKKIVSIVREAYGKISPRGTKTYRNYIIALTLLAALDAMGMALLALSLNRDNFNNLGESVVSAFGLFGTITIVIILFVSKSLGATSLYWRTSRAMAVEEVLIGDAQRAALSRIPWILKRRLTSSDYLRAIDQAPTAIVQGVLLTFAQLLSETLTAILIISVFLISDPVGALSSIGYFVSVMAVQQRLTSKRVEKAGSQLNEYQLSTNRAINELQGLNKIFEVQPSSGMDIYLKETRLKLATARANVQFFGTFPGYFMEATLALGFLTVISIAFYVNGPSGVVLSLGLFAAAGLRLLPSLNRTQTYALRILGNRDLARSEVPVSSEIQDNTSTFLENSSEVHVRSIVNDNSAPLIRLENVSFSYDEDSQVIKNVSLTFFSGKKYAFVGPSGSGKTTLVDIILGLLSPSSGTISRSRDVKLAYVPQDTVLVNGNLARNISLEWDPKKIDNDLIREAVIGSHLQELSRRDLFAGQEEISVQVSGGQKQRIGVARALYHDANFLVLDEATSSLDVNTEVAISQTLANLPADFSILAIAHRISTIKDFDEIFYLKAGRVLGSGTFEHLRKSIPEFQKMVDLSNLD